MVKVKVEASTMNEGGFYSGIEKKRNYINGATGANKKTGQD